MGTEKINGLLSSLHRLNNLICDTPSLPSISSSQPLHSLPLSDISTVLTTVSTMMATKTSEPVVTANTVTITPPTLSIVTLPRITLTSRLTSNEITNINQLKYSQQLSDISIALGIKFWESGTRLWAKCKFLHSQHILLSKPFQILDFHNSQALQIQI